MKDFDWDNEKNNILINERNISFEEITVAINEDKIVNVYEHPNQNKYPDQKIYEIELNDYIYLVPFIESKDKIFLKTIIPSRKATKKYFNRGEKNEQ
ncbi:MAG TPA: BrnT family toxin [Spirochaetota bacterium]|jgi:uncharacterized DUF497 family protein|nr:MAG: hypothetical protein BWX91_01913 [Spirochaetes bacterium ADurb.Bin133]HNZ26594.1 BrnT family toxin [Spirochaetota bacterium]HOF00664.1 BrnT family toxin [Spirochaetota bacterium]HOS32363.1 BrnT family toxin [Spirochaetota bacterium]HOS55610.1 BrnT family toxin [Spirochaetota bacterium]